MIIAYPILCFVLTYTVKFRALLTFSVKARLIPSFLTRVNRDPTFTMLGIYLIPDMIFRVPDPTYSAAKSTTKHAKTVHSLFVPTLTGVQKHECVIVSGEAFVVITA
jgi:hypothetical protein